MTGLLISAIVFALLFILKRGTSSSALALLLKILATLMLVIFSAKVLTITPDSHLGITLLFMLAIGFSLFGDVFLDLKFIVPTKGFSFLVLGILFFIATQGFYVTAFIRQTDLYYSVFVYSLILAFISYLISVYVFKYSMEGLAFLSTLYTTLVISVVMQTLIYAYTSGWQFLPCIFLVASILFMVADAVLSAVLFGNKNTKIYVSILHSSYYLAQILYMWGLYNYINMAI